MLSELAQREEIPDTVRRLEDQTDFAFALCAM